MGKFTKEGQIRPWDILKMSRAGYFKHAPWIRAGLPRKKFEELLAAMPEGFVDEVERQADAEKLVEQIFGGKCF